MEVKLGTEKRIGFLYKSLTLVSPIKYCNSFCVCKTL